MGLYGIGQPVPREEDPRLLRGGGRYVDDVTLARETRAYVLRSPYAAARIKSIDAGKARQSPGVLCVLTAAELKKRGLGALAPVLPRKKRDGSPAFMSPQPLLAGERVRYVGDPVAFVVAETLNQAKDAAELVEIDYEPLPCVVSAEDALAPGAPAVHDECPGNEAWTHEVGDKAKTDAAFAKAAKVVKSRIVINRITANSMEPRGCLAEYDSQEDFYTIRCTVQSVHGTRSILSSQLFRKPQTHFRVICDNMGGGFGMKGGAAPEYALALWAAEITGRPVKWISERAEGIATDEQARDSVVEAELALDKDAKFLALRTVTRPRSAPTTRRSATSCRPSWRSAASPTPTGSPAIHARVMGTLRQHHDDRVLSRRRKARAALHHRDGSSTWRRASWASTRPSCAAATTSRPTACPTRRRWARVYDCGDFRTNMDEAEKHIEYAEIDDAPRRRRRRAARCSASASPMYMRAVGRPRLRACRGPLRPVGRGDLDRRRDGSRPGPRHDLQAGAVRAARHRRRPDPLPLSAIPTWWTQGIGTFGSRSAVLVGGAVCGRRRPHHREGQEARRPLPRGGRGRHRLRGRQVHRRRHRPVDRPDRRRHARSFNQDMMPKGVEVGLRRAGRLRRGHHGHLPQRHAYLRGRDRRPTPGGSNSPATARSTTSAR